MNIPITKELARRLDEHVKKELLYGSRLFGTHNDDSDYDYVCLYEYDDVFKEKCYLPNIHSFQHSEGNTDIIYMTYEQFWNAFYNADGTLYADIILFSDWFSNDEALKMCRAYKIIKGYCGTAKRDMDLNKQKLEKINRRSAKNLYIAECLLNNEMPKLDVIKEIFNTTQIVSELRQKEEDLRKRASMLFAANNLDNYHIPVTEDPLLNIMLHGNNLKEYVFKK